MKIKTQPLSAFMSSHPKQTVTQKPNLESELLTSANKGTNQKCSLPLKEALAIIQQSQKKQGIKSLAAALSAFDMFEMGFIDPDIRRNRAITVGNRRPIDWDDFWYCDRKLRDEWSGVTGSPKVVTAITSAMRNMASNIECPSISRYSNSNLMKILDGRHTKIGVFNKYSYPHDAKVNAAVTFRYILEKVGHLLDDEIDTLRNLLISDVRDVREQGIIAAENTWKRPWRKNILGTALVRELRIESDQNLRNRAAWVIINANPKVLLEEGAKDDDSRYYPIELLTVISDPSIKLNMIYGLCSVIFAQRKEGKFYEDFKEAPSLNSTDIERCCKYSIYVLEDLINKNTLSENEKKLLHYTCVLISNLLDKDLNPIVRCLAQQLYDNQVNKLSNINLTKFIEFTTHSHFAEQSWRDKNTWSIASNILKTILLAAPKKYKNPLAYYLSLRTCVEQITTISQTKKADPLVDSNLDGALNIIDFSITAYLSGKNFKGITWQDIEEFNTGFLGLLQLLNNSGIAGCRSAALNVIDDFNQNGIIVGQSSLPFDARVNEKNMAALRSALRNNIYSQNILREQLISPSPATIQEKALLMARQITTSFKDYFGLTELKKKALETASEVITGKRFKKGFILSGINGMGKSFFGKTLAGELALPLQVIKGKEIDIDRLLELGEYGTVTLETYFELLKKRAPLILMLDEIQYIAPAEEIELTGKLIKCLQGVIKSGAPIILVGTTNEPEPVLIEGLHIDGDGSSTEIDEVLKTRIHPFCLEVMDGYYPFNQESLGIGFTKDYLTHLQRARKLNGNQDLEQVAQLARGIKPVDIIQIVRGTLIPEQGVFSLKMVSENLSKLSADIKQGKLEELVNLLESSVRYCTLKYGYRVEGNVDYKVLAVTAEGIPIKDLGQLLNHIPQVITQKSLLILLNSYRKDYQN